MALPRKAATFDPIKTLFGIPARELHRLLPGLLFAVALAWASLWLSDLVGRGLLGFTSSPLSPVMIAILLGLALGNALRLPPWLAPGLGCAVKKLLRLGIILLGVQLSLTEVFRLGVVGIPIVLGCILAALVFTGLLARILGLPERLGTLIAVGTSICGVSAILAAGPAIKAKDEEMAYAVSVITVFGLAATVVYPYLAELLFAGDPLKAGLFLGTAVHDTSQVTGAALLYADLFDRPEALNVAVVTKLVRNLFMVVVVPGAAFYHARDQGEANSRGQGVRPSWATFFPLFVLFFLLLAVARSVGDLGLVRTGAAYGLISSDAWSGLHGTAKAWAVNLLVVALAGVGATTRFSKLRRLGIKPFVAGLAAAGVVGVVGFLLIAVLGRYLAG